MNNMTKIMTGKELKRLRERAGMSQQEIADQIQYNVSSISRWENCKKPITPIVAAFLSSLYKTRIGLKDEKKPAN